MSASRLSTRKGDRDGRSPNRRADGRPRPSRDPPQARHDAGRLRLAALLLTVGAIAFGVVAATAAGTRSDAVDDVQSTESLLVRAVDVSASLSDAHAIAAYGFLVGGTEPAGSRPA